MSTDSFSTNLDLPQIAPGLPVELSRIDRELKNLWAKAAGSMTRASSINLAVYSETPGSLEQNTQLISRVTGDHACRAIVIAAFRPAQPARIEAWINAHCHLRGGSKQVCSEQISLLLDGDSVELLPSILFSQLDSDLPLYLWWRSEFREPMDPQLWTWVDRLVYDSQTWADFDRQMPLVEVARQQAGQRMVLCDLNWTRLIHFRLAFAQFFDHPAAHHRLDKLESVSIQFGQSFRSSALLLVGWLAGQLRWSFSGPTDDGGLAFKNRTGETVTVALEQDGTAPLSAFTARAGDVEFRIRRAACGDLLEVCRGAPGASVAHQLMPAGQNEPAELLIEELMRGGRHHVYLRAVEQMRSFGMGGSLTLDNLQELGGVPSDRK